jgi:cation transport protein ChaC
MRRLSLTSEHVARVHRSVADPGLAPGAVLHSEAEYDAWVAKIVATNPAYDSPVRLFAYGSLIWKPEIEHTGERTAVARGWHRSFCLSIQRFRGTPQQPGLMMALDRGGQCRGVLYDLPTPTAPGMLETQLGKLFRREFTYKPINSMPRWIKVETEAGSGPALAFVMNRASPAYAGRLSPESVADILASACGQWGTGAEYLLNTVTHLEARGIHDTHLWRLQELVAQRIERATQTPA